MQHFPARRTEVLVAAALWIGLGLFLAPRMRAAEAHASELFFGHLALDTGMSIQYDGTRTTSLGVATWTWHDDHYELAAFRFLTAQRRLGETLAGPNWVFEVSRRWRLNWSLVDRSGLQLFFGGGAAYKNETDELNGSHLNFAEQLGWRFPRQEKGGQWNLRFGTSAMRVSKSRTKARISWTLAYVF